ncbi:hypothetical protein QTP88_025206 [Uroleucon formosanum]
MMGKDLKLTGLEFRKLSLEKQKAKQKEKHEIASTSTGVPELSSGKGNEICSAVYNTLNDWCLLDQVEAFVFDTIASSSGRLNGACILLEQKLTEILYFLLIVTIFLKSFYKLFLLHQNYLLYLRNFHTWTSHPEIFEELKNVVENVLLFCTKTIEDKYPRDDYKEFIELVMIFLWKTPPRGIHFRPPGAYHLARWMAKEPIQKPLPKKCESNQKDAHIPITHFPENDVILSEQNMSYLANDHRLFDLRKFRVYLFANYFYIDLNTLKSKNTEETRAQKQGRHRQALMRFMDLRQYNNQQQTLSYRYIMLMTEV